MVKTNKYYVSIIISLVIGLLLGWGFDVLTTRNSNSLQQQETKIEDKNQKSVKDAIKEYDSIVISDKKNLDKKNATSLKELEKKLGNPIYNESSNVGDTSMNTKTWSIGLKNEVPVTITVDTIDNIVVDKSMSNIYTSYNNKYLVDADKYNNIPLNSSFKFEDAKNEFGEPNNINEYIDISGKKVVSATWNTNVKGTSGAFFNITFVNDIANLKTETGLNN
jgi:hypothetical protein